MRHRHFLYRSLFLALLVSGLLISAVLADGETTREFKVSPGGLLVVNLGSGGHLRITGSDRSLAQVTYDQAKAAPINVRINETANGLEIHSDTPAKSFRSAEMTFDIVVPRRFDLKLKSNGGNLSLSGLDGRFEGTTMGGSIEMDNVDGEAHLTTMGGPVQITNCELDGNVHTLGGTVLVRNVVGELKAVSNGGTVRYENVRSRNGDFRSPTDFPAVSVNEDTVLISTMGGPITVDQAPEGASVSTLGGNIRVDNAARFVQARTMGGDIRLDVRHGWIKAITMSGDIEVTLREDAGDGSEGIDLGTYNGDVTLVVPAGLSMDLDLNIAYTRNSDQNYCIVSDFPIDEQQPGEWDTSHGTPRRHIHGSGSVNGGHTKVRIRTINGNIYLKSTR